MPAIIAALLAALSRLIATRAGAWFVTTLSFLGLSLATQSFAVEPLLDQIISYANSSAVEAITWLRFFNFDKAITILASAVTVKYSLQSAKAFFKKA